MDRSSFYRVSRTAPQIMSLLALVICAVAWAGIVRDPPGDEGPMAHIYQLIMVGQIPLMVFFLVMVARRGHRKNVPVFGLQIALWISALAAVPILGL
jgi:hypothetical protein